MESLIKQYRKPDIKFFRDGRIYITARIAKEMDLKTGDAIDIIYGKGRYYLCISRRNAPMGYVARCYRPRKSSRFMRCNSTEITSGILRAAGARDKAYLLAGRAELIPEIGQFALPLNVSNNLCEQ